mmetsp:Transcript_18398/g.71090  ORF Transcript_18398/g.71090 Transcript_18398/m.71090 type:complete len:225 (+) Transcript_18398:349-1023(+)
MPSSLPRLAHDPPPCLCLDAGGRRLSAPAADRRLLLQHDVAEGHILEVLHDASLALLAQQLHALLEVAPPPGASHRARLCMRAGRHHPARHEVVHQHHAACLAHQLEPEWAAGLGHHQHSAVGDVLPQRADDTPPLAYVFHAVEAARRHHQVVGRCLAAPREVPPVAHARVPLGHRLRHLRHRRRRLHRQHLFDDVVTPQMVGGKQGGARACSKVEDGLGRELG